MLAQSEAILIGSHSGLRGRPGEGLTDEVVARTVLGLVELLRRERSAAALAVARDGRPSSARLATLVAETALRAGIDVLDIGVAATPTAKLLARRRELGGAAIVTGSHLDPSWNGLKLAVAPTYLPLDVRLLPEPAEADAPRPGRLRTADGTAEHAAAVVAGVDAAAIRDARLAVAVEGGAGPVAARVLELLGCRRDGRRPGAAFLLDPDGDRVTLSDERGRALDPEVTLPLVALGIEARTVVKGADTSRMVDRVVRRLGGSVRAVPTGERYLVQALLEENADLAGEGNGGVIVPHVVAARDGTAAAAAVLQLLARERTPLSELAAGLPALSRARSTVPCPDARAAAAALRALAERLGLELLDPHRGLTLEHDPDTWALVRASATEPVLRVTAEAPDGARADELHAELRSALLAVLAAE